MRDDLRLWQKAARCGLSPSQYCRRRAALRLMVSRLPWPCDGDEVDMELLDDAIDAETLVSLLS
jgi:hypothetical protein